MPHTTASSLQATGDRAGIHAALPQERSRAGGAVWIALAGLWTAAILLGFSELLRFAITPGVGASPGAAVVQDEPVLDRSRHTLLLFAHPQCPCTRANLAEIERILAGARGALSARIHFIAETDRPEDWVGCELIEQARGIQGLAVELDSDGVLASRLDVHTSGQAFVYSPDGRLQFAGGITRARGHEGVNESETAIAAILDGREPDFRRSPVFGCPISSGRAVPPASLP